jgi:cell division protein FtsA
MQEIIENASYQIPSEYSDKLLGGIILTGGGSNMRNIEKAVSTYTRIDKVRVAKFVTTTINSGNDMLKARNGMFNTVLGLLLKGDINCAGIGINRTGDLFDQQMDSETPAVPERRARQANEMQTGTIRTAQEEEKAAEEARRKKEEEDRLARQKQEEEEAAERQRKKENRWYNKARRGLGRFIEDLTKDE